MFRSFGEDLESLQEGLEAAVEELAQRFTRGDSSRNTEGSGLGISIALSLAKLIGADLKFKTDGDLFKVVLVLAAVQEGKVTQGEPLVAELN